jgi:hypothetical protein
MAIKLIENLQPSSSTTGGNSKIGVRYNKDYNLIAINLLGSNFPIVDLKPMMIEISYFEDVFNNVVSGNMLVEDAQGMIEKLQMHGNEYVRFAFGKDDNPNLRIDKLFRIYKISNRRKSLNFDTENYIIHFCSDELILSNQYKISKSYKGQGISNIIKDILNNKLKVPSEKYKESNIETTKGIYSIIVPNFAPFEAINWLCMYAQPGLKDNVGSDMVLYENTEGFNFKSLQSLFKQSPYFTYEFRPKNTSIEDNNNDNNKQVFNVLTYEIVDTFNTIESAMEGTFANRVLTVDPLLRRYAKIDFNYNSYSKKATLLNKNPVVNNLENRFGDALYETYEGCYKLSITNSGQTQVPYIKQTPGAVQDNFFVETYLPQRKSQLSLANHMKVKFTIAGDPNLTVGKTINFKLYSNEPASEKNQKGIDKYYSGKYLVTAVRHMIQLSEYITVFEAVKDSTVGKFDSVDNNSALWKNTVAGVKK